MLEKLSQDAEAITSIDPAGYPRGDVVTAVRESVRIRRELEAFETRAAAQIEDDGIYADAPFHSRNTKDLLERHCGLSSREANQRETVSRALPGLPVTEAALSSGVIGLDHAAVLARVVNPQTIGTLRQDERVMVGWAQDLTFRQMQSRVADWAADIDPAKHDAAIAPTTVTLMKGAKGRGLLTADLCPADYTKWNAQLCATEAAILRQEDADRKAGIDVPESSYDERLGQAFTIVLTRALSGPDDKISGGSRAQISLIVTPEQLAAGTGAHDLLLDQAVAPEAFSEFCCGSDMYRTVIGKKNEILDVGRTERTATRALRNAVVIRDRHCIIPHCDAPPRWCDIHHVVWFRNGGCTTISNLALVCGRHHQQIHAGKIRMTLIEGEAQQFRFENEHGEELRKPDLEADRHTQAA